MRSENEATILYTVAKESFILQSKGGHIEKFAAGEITVGALIKAPLQIRSHRTFQDIFSAPKKAPSGRKIIF